MNLKHSLNKMIENLPNKEYHSTGGLSSTSMKLIDNSVRVYLNRHLFPNNKSCFDLGNLIHDCILLPHLVDDTYIESPTKGLDTVKAKALKEENPNKIIVGQGDIEKYKTIAKAVKFIFPFLDLESTKKEVSFFYNNKDIEEIQQIRPDIYNPEIGMLLDVKSTKANNHNEFEKLIEQFDYDLSIAYYYDVLVQCGYEVNIKYVGWICIPKSEPYIPFMFRVSEELLEKGRSKYQRRIDRLKAYKNSIKSNGETMELIYDDIAYREAHSYEFRKQQYANEN